MVSKSTKYGRGGFTILERLVALMVLSGVAAFAIPAYFERSEITLENACVLLARDLRAAQNRSAYMGEPAVFVFDAEEHRYEVLDEFGDVIRNPTTMEPFVRHYPFDGVFDGVEIVEAAFGDDTTLIFDKRGEAQEGGYVILSFRGDQRRLELSKGTGRINVLGSTSGFVDDGL